MRNGEDAAADPLESRAGVTATPSNPPKAGAIRWKRRLGLSVIGIGLAHFAVPEIFDPINHRAFPAHTRLHTYINGAAESLIGWTLTRPRMQRAYLILYCGYPAYLLANLAFTRWTGSAP